MCFDVEVVQMDYGMTRERFMGWGVFDIYKGDVRLLDDRQIDFNCIQIKN